MHSVTAPSSPSTKRPARKNWRGKHESTESADLAASTQKTIWAARDEQHPRDPIKQESESWFPPTLTTYIQRVIYSQYVRGPAGRARGVNSDNKIHKTHVREFPLHRRTRSIFLLFHSHFSTYDTLSCNHGNSRGNQCQHQQQTRRYFHRWIIFFSEYNHI